MILLENITVRAGRKILLDNINADFSAGHCWVITGSNGSGKSVLGKVVGRLVEPEKGNITGDGVTGYSSFELQEKVMDAERRSDESRLMHGAVDSGTTVSAFLSLDSISDLAYAYDLIDEFAVSPILNRGLKFLSTGEFRKVLLLSALLEKPDLLVIDDPFDGLDAASREMLKNVIGNLVKSGNRIILITGRIEDYLDECSHMLLLSEGSVVYSGRIEEGIEIYKAEHLYSDLSGISEIDNELIHHDSSVLFSPALCGEGDDTAIIEMKNTTVSYSGNVILDRINWKVMKGDKWKITGVNGAGKSTLLSLVNGDNSQGYSNDITLFGRRRGTGESVWDIKKKIGFVSGDFQFKYRVRCTVLDTVISGLFDSIGLYEDINKSDISKGEKWLELLGLLSKKRSLFSELSFGEMRLVLIARAMIKDPQLLILDEPCQGLDSFNRDRVLALCELIGKENNRTILFVTHDNTVNLQCFTKSLILEKKDN